MNLPNKLTVLRVILIPFFVVSMMMRKRDERDLSLCDSSDFIIASLTDMLDGKIVPKYSDLVTDFWKIYGSSGRQAFSLFCTDVA